MIKFLESIILHITLVLLKSCISGVDCKITPVETEHQKCCVETMLV